MNNDLAEVGDLITIIDPVWDWLRKGDVGVVIKRKVWRSTNPSGSKRPDRYTYKVRFATSNQTRIVNRREFEILSPAKV